MSRKGIDTKAGRLEISTQTIKNIPAILKYIKGLTF